jgi:hypothetical protein
LQQAAGSADGSAWPAPRQRNRTDAQVYREADRRRGIISARYTVIEQDLGRPLHPP